MNRISRVLLPILLLTAVAPAEEEVIGPFRNSLTVDRVPVDRNAPMLKSYATMLEKVQPSVVTVFTGIDTVDRRRMQASQDDAAMRFFFGLPPAPADPEASKNQTTWQQLGLGTGVIVTKDGYILTNKHVVFPPGLRVDPDSLRIRVSIPGHEDPLDASIVDFSFDKDIAVLKVTGKDLPAAILTDSTQVKVGDVAFALGAPFGIDKTVTMGIISAKRNDEVVSGMEKQELLQTDASINPGNSGGPLVDADGRVIGINTAIYSNSGGNMGIGFAIPINNAVAAADALSRPRGYLGVGLERVQNLRAAAFYGLKGGAVITSVGKGTPGARAGLKTNDVIFQIDEKEVLTDDELRREIAQAAPGKAVTLHFLRDENRKTVRIILGERPNHFLNTDGKPVESSIAGMKLAPLATEEIEKLNPGGTGGLVVTSVEPNTPAANSGLQDGDVIVRINGQQPATQEEASKAFAAGSNGSSALHVRRGNATRLFLMDYSK